MRLLNILNYFAEVSEVMSCRDTSFSSEEINICNERLATISEDTPFQNMGTGSNEDFCFA